MGRKMPLSVERKKNMNIYVCVKHVPDSAATITVDGKNGINEKVTFLVNPYDEHALTEAATIKASSTGTKWWPCAWENRPRKTPCGPPWPWGRTAAS
jgi:hypothetical protein